MDDRPLILFLDAYDSFTNNITSQLTTHLHATIHVLHIDAPLALSCPSEFAHSLTRYDAIICGPGPGSPNHAEDVGLMRLVWQANVPVLGICLGFQVLATEFGGTVGKLARGLHGMVHDIEHAGLADGRVAKDVFDGVKVFKATLYHSLHADIGQFDIPDERWQHSKWAPMSKAPELVPLAWSLSRSDERILMAVRHATKPLWGMQYHPESVCTEEAISGVLRNWFSAALEWNQAHRASSRDGPGTPVTMPAAAGARRASYLGRASGTDSDAFGLGMDEGCSTYDSVTVALPTHIAPPDIVEILGRNSDNEHMMLDSSSAHAKRTPTRSDTTHDQKGRFSIIALGVSSALRLEYRASQPGQGRRERQVRFRIPDGRVDRAISLRDGEDVWAVVSSFWQRRAGQLRGCGAGNDDIPFRGGFMGYVTYEMGLEGIGVRPERQSPDRPDLCLVWVTQSLILDHVTGRLVIQCLGSSTGRNEEWLSSIVDSLTSSPAWAQDLGSASPYEPLPQVTVRPPTPEDYQSRVSRCQESIAEGDSYELCYTAQTVLTSATPIDPWRLYKALRRCQPAPFGSYLRLGGATLVSSSPERFLSHSASGLCRMHPMKGTVRKATPGRTDEVTREEAEAILQTPKERAENLMIVDLVRHDLHGVCGAGNVSVPVLMRVEEYASVFQMVTVVEGQLPASDKDVYTGIDVLAASLPPGSMTGAPKRRSCEILQTLEDKTERSLYSGVVGYIDITGRGDWSVTIRTLFRWDDEQDEGHDKHVWRIGAGGAVTGLSSTVGEWEEMMTKLGGPLGVFERVKA